MVSFLNRFDLFTSSARDAVALKPGLDGRAAEPRLALELLDALGRRLVRKLHLPEFGSAKTEMRPLGRKSRILLIITA